MAAGTKQVKSIPYRPEKEKIVGFDPEGLRAPFVLRCASLVIDYLVLIILPVTWLLLSRLLSESSSGASVGRISWMAGIVLSIANLLILPLWHGQTLGKLITGLTIVKTDGSRLDIRSLLVRNILGYAATVLTLGLGFLFAAVNNSGRAVHDLIGGTVVIRGQKERLQ